MVAAAEASRQEAWREVQRQEQVNRTMHQELEASRHELQEVKEIVQKLETRVAMGGLAEEAAVAAARREQELAAWHQGREEEVRKELESIVRELESTRAQAKASDHDREEAEFRLAAAEVARARELRQQDEAIDAVHMREAELRCQLAEAEVASEACNMRMVEAEAAKDRALRAVEEAMQRELQDVRQLITDH